MGALFFHTAQERPTIRALIAFTSETFSLLVYKWRTKSIKQQIQIYVIIGCRWRNRAYSIDSLPLVHWKLTPTWQPFWAVFHRQLDACCSTKLHSSKYFLHSLIYKVIAPSWGPENRSNDYIKLSTDCGYIGANSLVDSIIVIKFCQPKRFAKISI